MHENESSKYTTIKIDPEYHTLNEGIPVGREYGHLGMDTQSMREGLHMWIGHYENDKEGNRVFKSESVYLSRKDARNLVEEINKRLF